MTDVHMFTLEASAIIHVFAHTFMEVLLQALLHLTDKYDGSLICTK